MLVTSLGASGCECGSSKPYTPYKIGDAPPASASAVASGASSAPPVAAASFAIERGAAPNDAAHFAMDGGVVADAPPGRSFGEGVLLDADGDGARDLIAWTRAADGLRGELRLFLAKQPTDAKTITTLPSDLVAPTCSAAVAITRVGVRSVALDYAPRCAGKARDRAQRWIAIVRAPAPGSADAPSIGLELRAGLPAEGEAWDVSYDARDRDGDGQTDLAIALTLNGAPKPFPSSVSTTVTLAFYDRPAGLSRDPSEPEASLKAIAAALTADARKKTTASRVPLAALSLRRITSLVCEESGRPVVTAAAGPARCGGGYVDPTISEIEASVNLDDPIALAAALAKLPEAPRKDVERLVAKVLPAVKATALHTVKAALITRRAPSFGSIAFDRNGDVLVRGEGHVVRVDRSAFNEAQVDAALAWPDAIVGEGWTLTSIEARCGSPTIMGRFSTKDAESPEVELPLPIATPARCDSAALPVEVLGRGPEGTLAAIHAELFAIAPGPKPHVAPVTSLGLPAGAVVDLGAARSPDGKTIALATPRGVLVTVVKGEGRSSKGKLWALPNGDSPSYCAPDDAGERIACAVKGSAVIYGKSP